MPFLAHKEDARPPLPFDIKKKLPIRLENERYVYMWAILTIFTLLTISYY